MLKFEDIVERVAVGNNPKAQIVEPLQVIAGASDRPLIIGNIEIPCYVLEDETRVLSQRGVFYGMGFSRGGPRTPKSGGAELPRFAAQRWLNPFISNDLELALKSYILFTLPTGAMAYGYPATILVDLCDSVIEAHKKRATTERQQAIIERSIILLRGLAKVGIIALVDEATGYQRIREERALATILDSIISKELQPWTKTFPYDFYSEISRLKGWPTPHEYKRPIVFAKYTNDLVYERIGPGILSQLKKRNPIDTLGRRKHKHFQWFTPEYGHPKLREYLSGVMMLMNSHDDWGSFYNSLNKARPKLQKRN